MKQVIIADADNNDKTESRRQQQVPYGCATPPPPPLLQNYDNKRVSSGINLRNVHSLLLIKGP